MDDRTVLKLVKNTLNTIHVAGEEDLNNLLASIRAIQSLIDAIDAADGGAGQQT